MSVQGLLTQSLTIFVALLLAPLLTGWVNQCRAWLQNRSAPGLLQPLRMLHKLFHKDSVLAEHASPLFRSAPYIVFACMLLATALIPSLSTDLWLAPAADAIALVGLFALARVFISLAAMDIGTAFGSLGAEAERIHADLRAIIGRALCIRMVDAGSCNGCELEVHALGNPYYNLEGLGIKFVASPRHADLLLVSGPVSRHMAQALRRTWEAMPEPRLAVALGDCGCDGGVFGESYVSCGAVRNVIPVDCSVPGCPPPPLAILRGILAAVSVRSDAT